MHHPSQDRPGPVPSSPQDENGSLSSSATHTQTRSSRPKPSPSNRPPSSSSTRPHPPATNGKPKLSTPRPNQPSFLSRFLRRLVPCISPSSRAHIIHVDDADALPTKEKENEQEKRPVNDLPDLDSHYRQPDIPKPTEPPLAVDSSTSTPTVLSLTILPPSTDSDVITPPTPARTLLPKSDTAGVTSGAVQPPGSTGDALLSPHPHGHPHHGRNHTVDGSIDGDESDDTNFTEDEDMDDPNAVDEDDEDRLIISGGAGIPIGPDGIPRPLLPPLSQQHGGRKCLVLDLDETLVHSSFKSIQQADYVVPVEIEYHWHNVYVIKRPGVDNFLKKMGEIYEVVVFTASLSKYADPVLDKLDIHQVVSHRLFRESCYNHRGNYVKDLSQLGRPIADTIILDNSPASYIFHPNNAVPVSSWFNDPHDTELTDLVPFLADLSVVDDVRGVLDGGL